MLTCRPGQMCAYSRAEFLIKVEFLTRPFAGVALPAAGQATPERPTAAPAGAAPARQRRAGSWGSQGRNSPAPPLRGRAPPLPPAAVRPAPTTAALPEIFHMKIFLFKREDFKPFYHPLKPCSQMRTQKPRPYPRYGIKNAL